ncbi:PRC-barrel domain containing protein [bacterium]|nr:PRC-barrel domain containing protein [bacterium]
MAAGREGGRMDTMTRARTLSMSTLMNEPVRNREGQDIGKIEDYMLDLERGCVEYAVLSFGGFLGIGEKYFAIPWDSMRLDTQNHAWMLDVTKERLRQAPGFDKDNWPDLTDVDYRRSLSTFWTVNTGGDREQTPYTGVQDTQGEGYRREGYREEGFGTEGRVEDERDRGPSRY